MSIALIACINQNRGLGYQNQLLYKLPADMKFFRETTQGGIVIMGKNTFLSIGRPLPNRTNIVITRDKNFKAPGVIVQNSIDEAILYARGLSSMPENDPLSPLPPHTTERNINHNKISIIGGAQIYEQTIHRADVLYLTIVADSTKVADVFFPEYTDFKTSTLISQGESQGYQYKIIKMTK